MGIPNLKAIKDWCTLKFQPKGEYLTEKQLSAKNYVQQKSLGGMTFGVDENGNYGYIKAGADTVTPFKGDGGLGEIENLALNETYTSSTYNTIKIGNVSDVTLEKDYKYFVLWVEKNQDHNSSQDMVTSCELQQKTTGTYQISILAKYENWKRYYGYGIWILDGAKAGEIISINAILTLSNTTSSKKQTFFRLFGIN